MDVLRKEQKNQLFACGQIEKDMQKVVDQIKQMNTQTYTSTRVSEETQNQTFALKAKSENEKINFEMKLKDL